MVITSDVRGSVFYDLFDNKEEAEDLTIRADLMRGINDIIRGNGWSRKKAAAECGVPVSTINDLAKGHIDKLSRDALIKMATHLGETVRIERAETHTSGE